MFELKNHPLVVAHRGSSGTFPENSLPAFKRAIEIGADMIEIDIQCSSDGKVLVFHDHRINRTTNGRGKVSSFTLKELQVLDSGSWFNKRFSGETIPLLRDVMKLCAQKIQLNIEIKSYGNDAKYNFIVEKSIKLSKEFGMENDVIFSSFDHNLLREFWEYDPNLNLAVLYDAKRHARKSPSLLCRLAFSKFFIADIKVLKTSLVKDAHDNDLVVGTYTIETEAELERALKFGADIIMSDHPEQILRWLGRSVPRDIDLLA
ncbi:MAG: glycerophosphodiester phosphodiesterase family protein [Bacteroidota bacterium]